MGSHPLLQPGDWHSSNRQQEREEREARRRVLREARKPLFDIPVDHMFEIPGRCAAAGVVDDCRRGQRFPRAACGVLCLPACRRRLVAVAPPSAAPDRPPPPLSCCSPNVVLQIKNYMLPNAAEGRQRARSDIPFLFKAFETGQAPPPRPGTKKAEVRRAGGLRSSNGAVLWCGAAERASSRARCHTRTHASRPGPAAHAHAVPLPLRPCARCRGPPPSTNIWTGQ